MFPVTLNHKKSGNQILKPLRDKKEFVDAKLRSEFRQDKIIVGHRVVLAGVSSILKRHFTKSPNVQDTIVVKNIDHETLEKIVDFIYSGKIVVSEDDWDDFSNACRMINLRLGAKTDKILYDMDSDNDDEEDNHEKNKSGKKEEPPVKIKKELDIDMIPTSSNVPFGESEEPTRPRLSEDFDLPFPDPELPSSSVISGLISCVSGIKHKKRLKLEPRENDTNFPQTLNPQLKIERSVSPPLLRGRNGYFWISVENVLDDVEKNVVKDTCSHAGELMDFMSDKAMKTVYAAYKTKDEAKKALETLKFNGSTACYNTTNIPTAESISEGIGISPLMLSQPPPPPVLPKVTFGGFGESSAQLPFIPRQPPPPFSKQIPPPPVLFSTKPPPFVTQPLPQPPFHSQPPPHFTGKPPPLSVTSHPPPFPSEPPLFSSQPPPFLNKPPPFTSQPPPFTKKPPPFGALLSNHPPKSPGFGTAQPNLNLFSRPGGEHFPMNNSRNRAGPAMQGTGLQGIPGGPPQRTPGLQGTPGAGPDSIEVYLGNLPNKTNEQWLVKYLRKKHVSFVKGSIRIFEAPAKLAPTKCKTYGFVHCATRQDADHFIKVLNGKPCRKRNLVVKDAAEGKKKKQKMLETSEGVLGSLPPEDEEENPFGGEGVLGSYEEDQEIPFGGEGMLASYEDQEIPFGGEGVLGSGPSEMEIEEGVAGEEWDGHEGGEPFGEGDMMEGRPSWDISDQEGQGYQRGDSAGRERGSELLRGAVGRDGDGWDWKRSHKKGDDEDTNLDEGQSSGVANCEPDTRVIPSLLDIVVHPSM